MENNIEKLIHEPIKIGSVVSNMSNYQMLTARYFIKIDGEEFGHSVGVKEKDKLIKIAKYLNKKTGKGVSVNMKCMVEYFKETK